MRPIRVLDLVFTAVLLGCLLAREAGWVEDSPRRPVVLAVMLTAISAHLLARLALEYRAGVSARLGVRSLVGPDYPRADRPAAFWWGMGLEALLLAASTAGAVWCWGRVAAAG